jgi:hypothetical protein
MGRITFVFSDYEVESRIISEELDEEWGIRTV